MPAPTHSQGGKEEIKNKSLFSGWNKTAATCPTFAQQRCSTAACVCNKLKFTPQRHFLGFNSARNHQGLGVSVRDQDFPSGWVFPAPPRTTGRSEPSMWCVTATNKWCFLLSNLISVLNSSSANVALSHRGNVRGKHPQFYIFQV